MPAASLSFHHIGYLCSCLQQSYKSWLSISVFLHKTFIILFSAYFFSLRQVCSMISLHECISACSLLRVYVLVILCHIFSCSGDIVQFWFRPNVIFSCLCLAFAICVLTLFSCTCCELVLLRCWFILYLSINWVYNIMILSLNYFLCNCSQHII